MSQKSEVSAGLLWQCASPAVKPRTMAPEDVRLHCSLQDTQLLSDQSREQERPRGGKSACCLFLQGFREKQGILWPSR